MPVEVVGLREARKAMRKIQPDLDKELKKELREVLKPLVRKAQSYVPMTITGLSNWTVEGKSKGINAQTSAFRTGFPLYIPSEVRKGIKSELSPTKPNRSGFVSLVRIVNNTRAGAIYETAGRKNPQGQPWNPKSGSHAYSHSRNKNAGKHFIDSMGNSLKGQGAIRGRLIYRAWNEDQGRTLAAVMRAIEKTATRSKQYVDAAKAFRRAA